jgi:DNA polymerase bacteriophage-type
VNRCNLDYETASRANLRKVGADVYSRHATTKVLMLAWGVDDGPVEQWFPHKRKMPSTLADILHDRDVRKLAFNAPFELAITRNTLGLDIDITQWGCTQVLAHSLGLPGKLELLVRDCLALPKQYWKDPEGDRLMRLFSYPNSKATWESHPREFEAYADYNRQDVIAERKAFTVMSRYVKDIDDLYARWHVDQRINARGIPVDLRFIDQALEMAETSKAEYAEKLKEMTGLKNPNSTAQLLPWLNKRGYPFSSIARNRVQIAMKDSGEDINPEAVEVLKTRLESNKSSLKKYVSMRDYSVGGRLRNVYQYMGAAATGRWAGRILGQNMPRPWKGVEDDLEYARMLIAQGDLDSVKMFYGKPMEVLASSIRSAIAPRKGKKLVVADLSSIELVVSAWLCGAKFWLDVVEQGLDAYKAFGSRWFEVPYEQITKDQRQLSKPAALGAAYRLGAGRQKGEYPDIEKTGLWGYSAAMGIAMTKEQCKEAIKVYRAISPEIVNWWHEVEAAAMQCVLEREPTAAGNVRFDLKAPFLRMRLPSGRYIHYCRPRVQTVKMEWEDEDGNPKESWVENVTYERTAQQSGKWTRATTQGGKLLENAVQAIARDILEYGILNAEKEGLEVVLHAHDEIVCEVDENRSDALKTLISCMTRLPKWAEGMTVRAEGYEGYFYRK